jgi:cytidine deaminase
MDLLIEAALGARQNAHAPFSRFKVGAALEDSSGRIHTGCNVENATYGLTLCAELHPAAPAGKSYGSSAAMWNWCSLTLMARRKPSA